MSCIVSLPRRAITEWNAMGWKTNWTNNVASYMIEFAEKG